MTNDQTVGSDAAEEETMNIYNLFAPVYKDVYEDIKFARVKESFIKGGRGSGKSTFAALCAVMAVLRDRRANVLVLRRYMSTLRDSVLPQLVRAAQMLEVAPSFEVRLSPPELRYRPTGQKILLRGADDPMKSKGLAPENGYFSLVWFEEAAEERSLSDIRSIIQSALRGSDKAVCLYTFNPPADPSHWINRLCLTPPPGAKAKHTCYRDLPREWLGERFWFEAERLRRTDPQAYLNEYEGVPTGRGGRVFNNLELRPLSDGETDACDKRFLGLDFGFALDPDALTLWGWDKKRQTLTALDEKVCRGQDSALLAAEIHKMGGRSVVYCDSADPRLIKELKSLGVNAAAVKKGPGSRESSIRWLSTLNKIVIDPGRTPVIAKEFSEFCYETDKNGEFIPAYPDKNDHTIDSCRYAMEREISVRRALTL
ncbi:MAG: phage terminase large subunit [Clostridia bacterium]|nr:phage terminase large subunit [Clostridia bacterium]